MKKKLLFTLAFVIVLVLACSLSALAADSSFETNLANHPGWYSDGHTQPIFNYSQAIQEEVWVELPIDTDGDGLRDLIHVQIRRPVGEPSDRFPVILEHSPYTDGTLNIPNHSVMHEQVINPDTTHYTYEDVESVRPRAADWPWTSAKISDYESVGVFIPAARDITGLEVVYQGAATNKSAAAAYAYMLERGYAVAYSDSVGNRYADGWTDCGDVAEVLGAVAIIKWLNGEDDVHAFYDKACTKLVDATQWANGNVAMTGQSYNGTLPIAVACTGVEGLKAIIPRAAISSWYDYYRGNGAVVAPGGYQGEDADVLAEFCASRYNYATATQKAYFDELMAKMYIDQDRVTGDYNRFWDDRNYLATADRVTAAVMLQHGFNDWNVKTKNFDQFYRAVSENGNDVPFKLVLHLGAHTTVFQMDDGVILDYTHQWFDRFLYGIENGAEDSIPNVNIANSKTGEWQGYDSWPIAGSENHRYYLVNNDQGNGVLLESAGGAALHADTLNFKDDPALYNSNVDPGSSMTAANAWESKMVDALNIDLPNNARLAFVSAPLTQDVRLNGVVTVTLDITPDMGKGSLSAALVEIGPGYRSYSTPTTRSIPAYTNANGTMAGLSLQKYAINTSSLSQYKIVTRGSTDVQNPNPSGKTYLDAADTNYIPEYYYQTTAIVPGQTYSYTFEMEAMDYIFQEGQRLAVLVYSTDYRYTIIPRQDITGFTLNLGENSYINLPLLDPLYDVLIITQPEGCELKLNEAASIDVEAYAAAGDSLSYEWYVDGVAVATTSDGSYPITGIGLGAGEHEIYAAITNTSTGYTMDSAAVTVFVYDYMLVNGVQIGFTLENGIAVINSTQQQINDILAAAGKGDIVFDFSQITAVTGVDFYVGSTWFNKADNNVVFKLADGERSTKAKTIWNNSGKTRLVEVRDNLTMKNL